MANLMLIAAAVVGGFALLRIIMGSSSSYSARHGSVRSAESKLTKVEAYENQINRLQRFVRTAPSDRQRELAAKTLERFLKQKERLKRSTERLVKKS
ncbi:hypothetical protein HYU16_03735 [Candidatus Woesearchaeota archaeon]|nr:hypothetical protein [Candidatus Woesearchaeota archaeon]